MRKEVFIVILIGIVIGAIVAFGIYTAQTAIESHQAESPTQPETPETEPPVQKTHTLIIHEPQNESISQEEEITISGSTTKDAVVTIIAEENEYLLTADSNGDFSAEATLVGGANIITVSAFDEKGNRAEEVLTLVYSTQL